MLMMNFEYSPKILKIASLCDAIDDAQVSDHKKDDEYKSSQGHSQSLLSQRCFARLSPDGLTHTPVRSTSYFFTVQHSLFNRHFPFAILFHRITIPPYFFTVIFHCTPYISKPTHPTIKHHSMPKIIHFVWVHLSTILHIYIYTTCLPCGWCLHSPTPREDHLSPRPIISQKD